MPSLETKSLAPNALLIICSLLSSIFQSC